MTTTQPNDTDYLTNSYGRRIPKSTIHPIDLLRDDLVTKLIADALNTQDIMRRYKQRALSDITAFLSLSAEQYNIQWGGRKGNLSLVSYDGRYKIMLAVSDKLSFDERLHIAKQLIDECIHKWTEGSNDNLKVLIEHAFQTDKQGNINTSRIFELMRIKIDDPDWEKAMQALEESIQVTSTTQYLRLYERQQDSDKYTQISLDLAGL